MPVRFECPQCGKTLSAAEGRAGEQAQCDCGASVPIPEANAAERDSGRVVLEVAADFEGRGEVDAASPTVFAKAPSARKGRVTRHILIGVGVLIVVVAAALAFRLLGPG